MSAALEDFARAQLRLEAALDALYADDILSAAADLHRASAALALPGACPPETDVAGALAAALKQIESCRLRVMFLTDHVTRRVETLTARVPVGHRYRPDRHA